MSQAIDIEADDRTVAHHLPAAHEYIAYGRGFAGGNRGRGGLEPVRYEDWEVKGIASDF